VLNTCVEALCCASILLEPVIPGKARELRKQLGIKRAPFDLDSAAHWGLVPAGTHTAPGEPLFPRIDLEALEKAMAEPEPEPLEHKAEISIHDFSQVELRVVTVEKAEPHPNADKLLVLSVRMGPETRTVVSGIRAHYAPEDLVGKKLILVANLKPVTLRGVRSEGMILAAEDEAGNLSVATLEADLPDGSEVR
jgi:methionyl-tRNA synthetase